VQRLGPVLAFDPIETWGEVTRGWHLARQQPVDLFAWLGDLPQAMGRARRLMVEGVRAVAPVVELLRYEGDDGPTTVAASVSEGIYIHELVVAQRLPRELIYAILRDLAEGLGWIHGPQPIAYGQPLSNMKVGFDGITRVELAYDRPPPPGVIVNYFPDAADLNPERVASDRADVWRLGVLAAELLLGYEETRFGGRSSQPARPELLQPLGAFLESTLLEVPEERPTMGEIVHALEGAAAPPEVVASVIGELFPEQKRAHLERVEELSAQLPAVDDDVPVEVIASL
jgi:hypothetical protein